MTSTIRYVPSGSCSLRSDAPGWSAETSSGISSNSGSEGEDGGVSSSVGPTCWKCKGERHLALKAQDVKMTTTTTATMTKKMGKKKEKRLARKRALREEKESSSDKAAVVGEESGRRVCPVCHGRGHLPVRAKLAKSSCKAGVITARRRRPRGWVEFGHVPAPVRAAMHLAEQNHHGQHGQHGQRDGLADGQAGGQTGGQAGKESECGVQLLSRANGRDEDFEGQRQDVAVLGSDLQDEPAWLPSGAGEQLCNLVGRWRILQRVGSHRWTTDDLVTAHLAASSLAARLPPNAAADTAVRYLDLGTGNGSVLQMVSWYLLSYNLCSSLHALGVEARSDAVALARRSLAFNFGPTTPTKSPSTTPSTNPSDAIPTNVQILHADFRDLSSSTTHSTLAHKHYDLITGTPPYFRVGFKPNTNNNKNESTTNHIQSAIIQQGGMPTSIQSAPARCEFRGGVEAYCLTASSLLASPNGIFTVCENWFNNERVYQGAKLSDLKITTVLPVMGKRGRKDPLFAVYVMEKSSTSNNDSNDETEILPPLHVRDENGKWTQEYAKLMQSMSIPVIVSH